MKVLVVGKGGREHALAWKLARHGHEVVCAPGNPGVAAMGRSDVGAGGRAECVAVRDSDIDGLVELARERAVDLVVIGPEAPLVAGLADRLRAAGIAAFGPGADGARLEGSKVFCKQFFARHGIPTAAFRACETVAEADEAIAELGALCRESSGEAGVESGVVVKADGLAAGKGVIVCDDAAEARAAARAMLEQRRFGDAGARIVVEQRLCGRELSVMAIAACTDAGARCEILAQAEDHKAIRDGDQGPNTGGMGAVSPPTWTRDGDDALLARIEREVFAPTLRGLAADGIDYRGVLYAGLMIADDGTPRMLEYNCRFGDPETQPVLARLEDDLAPWLLGAARGALPDGPMRWDPRVAVCVVLASAGYPGAARTGDLISGLTGLASLADAPDVVVFHAGTAPAAPGTDAAGDPRAVVTAGGRVLGVTALAADVSAARTRAYDAVAAIQFEGMQYRRDIGARRATREPPG